MLVADGIGNVGGQKQRSLSLLEQLARQLADQCRGRSSVVRCSGGVKTGATRATSVPPSPYPANATMPSSSQTRTMPCSRRRAKIRCTRAGSSDSLTSSMNASCQPKQADRALVMPRQAHVPARPRQRSAAGSARNDADGSEARAAARCGRSTRARTFRTRQAVRSCF